MPNSFPDAAFDEVAKKYTHPDFIAMLTLLRGIMTVEPSQLKKHDKYLYANALTTKIYRQSNTIKYLLAGTKLFEDQIGERVLDTHSMEVISRSIFESYLVFHHIYVASKSEDEKEFKFKAWMKAGLLGRQKFPTGILDFAPALQAHTKAKLAEEQKLIDEVTKEMETNSFFTSVMASESSGRRRRYKKFLRDGWTISDGDTPVLKYMEQANLRYFIERDLWGMTSRRAHSDFTHVADIVLQNSFEDLLKAFQFTTHVLALILARLCLEYPVSFPHANKPVEVDSELSKLATVLVRVSENEVQDSSF